MEFRPIRCARNNDPLSYTTVGNGHMMQSVTKRAMLTFCSLKQYTQPDGFVQAVRPYILQQLVVWIDRGFVEPLYVPPFCEMGMVC